MAAAGATAALPLLAPDTARGEPRKAPSGGLVDVHHHLVPPFWIDENRDRIVAAWGGRVGPAFFGWSVENSLRAMDGSGVQIAILSLTSPGVWFGVAAESRKIARRANEYAAGLVRAHPGRFGFFASLPLPDAEGSLRELEYALDVLHADGVGLLTSYDGRWLGDASYAPVFEELNRRKCLVFVHPTVPASCLSLLPDVRPVVTEVPQDTARAIANLLYTGSLVRFRDVRFIFSHAGGTMPMIYGRMLQVPPVDLPSRAPLGIEHELRRLHYDIAATAYRPAIAALTTLVPTSRILLGSDSPFTPVADTVQGLGNLGLSDADVRAIGRDNAIALLPRLASP